MTTPGPMGPYPAPGNPPTPSNPTPPPAPGPPDFQTQLNAFLGAERQNESGGNYQAYNAAGGAAGAYQFIQPTWNSWAQKVAPQYVGVNPAQVPANIQDQVAGAMASSYYNQDGGNWQNVAESWYYPAWAGVAADQNKVPYPSAGNTLTIGQYGTNVVDAMNKLLGSSGQGQDPRQQALNGAGQQQIGAIGAGGAAQAAGTAAGATAAIGNQQVSQQQLLNQLNDTMAQLGISNQQLDIQQTGMKQQNLYEQGNWQNQLQALAEQAQNLDTQYGYTQQQLGLSGTEIGQQHQQAEENALSNLAANGVYNTGTYGRTMTPIEQQYQNALASLGIQTGQAAQSHQYSQEQLANERNQGERSFDYQQQQLNNAWQQSGLARQGLDLSRTQANQAFQTGNEAAYNNLLSQLAGLTQQYGGILPAEASQTGNLLSQLVGVGNTGTLPGGY